MKTNSLLTYVLYALLAGLILVAGYKACQIRQEQTTRQKENAELDQVMRDLGYSGDSTAGGSSYVPADSAGQSTSKANPTTGSPKTPGVSPSGIENDDPTPRTQTGTGGATTTVVAKPKTTAKSPGLTGNPPVTSGRYMVITGSFQYLDNARDEMETLVKAGYRNAEVKKFPDKARVIALRTNDRAAAERAVEKLRNEGYVSAYVKTQ